MIQYIVAVGDLHLNFWKAFAKGNGTENSRFKATLSALERSLQTARELNALWLLAGDWVHTIGFTHNPVLTALIELLNKYNDVEKATVWGNHDARSSGGLISLHETAVDILEKAVPSLVVLNQTSYESRSLLNVFGEGYQPNLNDLAISRGVTSHEVGLFHQTVAESRLPSGIRNDYGVPQEWLFTNFGVSIVGDVHEPQLFERDGRYILVPGSLEPHNFGDISPRGFWVITLNEGDGIHFSQVESNSPKFITVATGAEVRDDGNFYRVTSAVNPGELPENAVVVAAPPTTIEQRNLINPGSSTTDVVASWVEHTGVSLVDGSYGDRCIKEGLQLLEAEGPSALKVLRLKEVTLHNFFCYHDTGLKIEEGVTLVTGQSKDFSSNGAGKSTLFESIFWGLFGKTTKGVSSDEVIRRGEPGCFVGLEFEEGLSIVRARGRGESSILSVQENGVPWEGTQKDLNSNLQKYLGITPELFQSLAYFSQSKLLLFSQATDSERKGMLSDLCGFEIYQRASTQARKAAERTIQEIARISQSIVLFEDQLRTVQLDIHRLGQKSDQWNVQAEEQRKILKNEIALVSQVLYNLQLEQTEKEEELEIKRIQEEAAVEERRPEIEAKHRTRLEHAIAEIVAEKEIWRSSLPSLPEKEDLEHMRAKAQQDLELVINPRLSKSRTEAGECAAMIRSRIDQINTLKKTPEKCPTCGAARDLSEVQKEIKEHESLMEISKERLAVVEREISSAQDELAQKTQGIRLLEGYLIQHNSREHTEKVFNERIEGTRRILENQLVYLVDQEIKTALISVKGSFSVARTNLTNEYLHKVTSSERELSELQSQEAQYKENPYKDELVRVEESYKAQEGRIYTLRIEVEALREKNDIYNFWATGFSRSGIQSLLMDEIAGSFNEIRALVFPTLTRGVYDVQFTTVSQTAQGESRERSDFIIRDRGALVSYESLSGGQRRRVDLGVMLTLALAVARTRAVPGVFGVLILDEVFGFLDEDGVEALYDTLEEVQRVVPSIYCVTHNPALQSLFKRILRVEQDTYGVSRLAVPGALHSENLEPAVT